MKSKIEVVRGPWSRTSLVCSARSQLLGEELPKAVPKARNGFVTGMETGSRAFSTFRSHLEVLDKEITDSVAESEKRIVMLATVTVVEEEDMEGSGVLCQVQSGFFVSGCGKILTAAHGLLVETSPRKFRLRKVWVISVGLQKHLYDIKVLAIDTGTDVALLKLPALPDKEEYPHVNMSDQKLLAGQFMFTIGHLCCLLSIRRFGNLACFESSHTDIKH